MMMVMIYLHPLLRQIHSRKLWMNNFIRDTVQSIGRLLARIREWEGILIPGNGHPKSMAICVLSLDFWIFSALLHALQKCLDYTLGF